MGGLPDVFLKKFEKSNEKLCQEFPIMNDTLTSVCGLHSTSESNQDRHLSTIEDALPILVKMILALTKQKDKSLISRGVQSVLTCTRAYIGQVKR